MYSVIKPWEALLIFMQALGGGGYHRTMVMATVFIRKGAMAPTEGLLRMPCFCH